MNGFLKGTDDEHIGNRIQARVTVGYKSRMMKVKRNDNFDIKPPCLHWEIEKTI